MIEFLGAFMDINIRIFISILIILFSCQSLAKNQKKMTINLIESPPWIYLDNRILKGQLLEVFRAIGDDLDISVDVQISNILRAKKNLKDKSIDYAILVFDEEIKAYGRSVYIVPIDIEIITLSNFGLESMANQKCSIAIFRGSFFLDDLKKINCKAFYVDSLEQAKELFMKGRVEGVYGVKGALEHYFKLDDHKWDIRQKLRLHIVAPIESKSSDFEVKFIESFIKNFYRFKNN